MAAAIRGHLHILQWAVASGCDMEVDAPTRFNLCEYAAKNGLWEIVQLARDHGCSCSDDIKLQCIQHQQRVQSQKQLSDIQN